MKTQYAGYMGKVMTVDLTTETVSEYSWSDQDRELYLGGKIMAAKILCDHLTGKENAFSEENWIVISLTLSLRHSCCSRTCSRSLLATSTRS